MKIHIVKQGDTLYELAQKYNVELDKLIAANPQLADPNVLEIGMKVKIPDAPKPVAPPSEIAHKHVVVQGDTLWKLGKAWGVPLPEMIAANPHLKNPNVLMTGETVFIPKKKDGSNTEANVVNPPKPDTSVLPSAEALPQQLPAEVNVEQAPNIEMEVQSAPNVLAETPPAPIQAELPAFPNVNFEPFAQPAENPNIPVAPTQYMQPNIQEMQPHVQGMQANVLPYANVPMAEAVPPFQQYNVPAAEAFSANVQKAESNEWKEQTPPQLPPLPASVLPAYTGNLPPYPAAGGDCGCGGPALPTFPHAMPYSNYPVAGAYDPNVMAAQSNYPVAGAYDPNVMAAQSNHPVAGAYDPNVMAAQSNYPVA
ncbi:LysM peptidoglycan-binding domain-containing protein, partial [Paenibacillus ginsengihumi]|uniref:LysM peptidoglycan-binding domain-containing protein n=1 Tax=Paenibacillus ginsengihumi TaxID=431596 RepID=UPI00036FD153